MTSIVELAVSLAGAVVFTLAGLFVEFQSLLSFAAGELSTGAWFGLFGFVLLYAGVYLLGYERVAVTVLTPTE